MAAAAVHLSDEQRRVLATFKSDPRVNIQIEAVPGSGKTTTCLALAADNPHLAFLLLTYNRPLRKETLERVRSAHIANLQVHTYHSLCRLVYAGGAGYTDKMIKDVVCAEHESSSKFEYKFDCLLLDEQQDCTHLLHAFVYCKVIPDMCRPGFQIVACGDSRQNIYAYKGTDVRFLQLASRIYGTTHSGLVVAPHRWVCLPLSQTRRLTAPMVKFVNAFIDEAEPEAKEEEEEEEEELLKPRHRMRCRDSTDAQVEPVVYLVEAGRSSSSRTGERTVQCIAQLIEKKGYAPGDFMVLSPSLRRRFGGGLSLTHWVQQALSRRNIVCYVPGNGSDECETLDEAAKNKICFSTFHQSKGRERKVVVVLGFDDSYTKIFARSERGLPNPMYVALTRATERLFVVQSADYCALSYLPPVDVLQNIPVETNTHTRLLRLPQEQQQQQKSSDDCSSSSSSDNESQQQPTPNNPYPVCVMDLLRHAPDDFLDELLLEVTPFFSDSNDDSSSRSRSSSVVVDLPSVCTSCVDGSVEEVSDVNGIVANLLLGMHLVVEWEQHVLQIIRKAHSECISLFCLEHHRGVVNRMRTIWTKYLSNEYDQSSSGFLDDMVFVAVVFQSIQSGYTCRALQLPPRGWWSPRHREGILVNFANAAGLEEHDGSSSSSTTTTLFYYLFEHTERVNLEATPEFPLSISLSGSMDIVRRRAPKNGNGENGRDDDDSDVVYEIKCISGNVESQHKMQLLLYWFLYSQNHGASNCRATLINVRNGYSCSLARPAREDAAAKLTDAATRIVRRLVHFKRNGSENAAARNDEEFVKSTGDAYREKLRQNLQTRHCPSICQTQL